MTFSLLLAEILPSAKPFWEYSSPPPGTVASGLFFLLLICLGITAEIGLVLHWMKRPVPLPELSGRLSARALPWQLVMIFFGGVIGFYLLTSWLYLLMFPQGEVEPHTVIFQTLLFHLPGLGLLGLLFHIAGVRACELFGLHWKKAPAWLGLSVIFYLAALPLLWLCSALYQIFLQHFGREMLLQDIAQVLTVSAPWPVRTLLFFIVIIVAPVFEEIVFRGVLLPFMVRRTGFWPGIVLVSMVFGGMHFHLPSFLPLFLLSVMFSLAYARTQSLLVPIGMHVLFNGVTVVLLLLMG
ncbi:MAG: CPBP family intramembrane metalloprotease [Kiritimatiellaceae bacterium]|nr:CPBP family intramembrane metalloprotease [Kiritimatiellaceae bacterium]